MKVIFPLNWDNVHLIWDKQFKLNEHPPKVNVLASPKDEDSCAVGPWKLFMSILAHGTSTLLNTMLQGRKVNGHLGADPGLYPRASLCEFVI